MFSPAPDQPVAAPAPWRGALRHAADLTLAFTTLESYTVEDLWPPRRRDLAGPFDPPAAAEHGRRRSLTADGGAGASATVPGTSRRAASTAQPATSSLQRAGRTAADRRPGASRAPAQPCTTPLPAVANPTTRGATAAARALQGGRPVPGRRRTPAA